jgi:hypothetical protein
MVQLDPGDHPSSAEARHARPSGKVGKDQRCDAGASRRWRMAMGSSPTTAGPNRSVDLRRQLGLTRSGCKH